MTTECVSRMCRAQLVLNNSFWQKISKFWSRWGYVRQLTPIQMEWHYHLWWSFSRKNIPILKSWFLLLEGSKNILTKNYLKMSVDYTMTYNEIWCNMGGSIGSGYHCNSTKNIDIVGVWNLNKEKEISISSHFLFCKYQTPYL